MDVVFKFVRSQSVNIGLGLKPGFALLAIDGPLANPEVGVRLHVDLVKGVAGGFEKVELTKLHAQKGKGDACACFNAGLRVLLLLPDALAYEPASGEVAADAITQLQEKSIRQPAPHRHAGFVQLAGQMAHRKPQHAAFKIRFAHLRYCHKGGWVVVSGLFCCSQFPSRQLANLSVACELGNGRQ